MISRPAGNHQIIVDGFPGCLRLSSPVDRPWVRGSLTTPKHSEEYVLPGYARYEQATTALLSGSPVKDPNPNISNTLDFGNETTSLKKY